MKFYFLKKSQILQISEICKVNNLNENIFKNQRNLYKIKFSVKISRKWIIITLPKSANSQPRHSFQLLFTHYLRGHTVASEAAILHKCVPKWFKCVQINRVKTQPRCLCLKNMCRVSHKIKFVKNFILIFINPLIKSKHPWNNTGFKVFKLMVLFCLNYNFVEGLM